MTRLVACHAECMIKVPNIIRTLKLAAANKLLGMAQTSTLNLLSLILLLSEVH